MHRLVTSEGDGKVVEVAAVGARGQEREGAGGRGAGGRKGRGEEEEGEGELMWHTKLEGMAAEYNGLLREELGKQRDVYREQLATVRKYGKREVNLVKSGGGSLADALRREERAIRKKLEGTRARREKAAAERDFAKNLASNLQMNRKENDLKVDCARKELEAAQAARAESLPKLKEEVERLMLRLDGGG